MGENLQNYIVNVSLCATKNSGVELMLHVCTVTSSVTCRTGKTSIVCRYNDNYDPHHPPKATVGVDCSVQTIEVDNKLVKLAVSGDYSTVPCFSFVRYSKDINIQ